MENKNTLRIRDVTDGVKAAVSGVKRDIACERERQRQRESEADRAADNARAAAQEARAAAARDLRIREIADAVSAISGGPAGWTGIYRRGGTDERVRAAALEWTSWRSPGAKVPHEAMIAAREAELVVKDWLERRLATQIRDVSMEKTYCDEEGPAFRRYDLLEEAGSRRYDVKNTVAPPYARHVLGRDKPAAGVTLVGVARTSDQFGARYELLGALDADDIAAWDVVLSALNGIGILVSPTTTKSGALVRPSWTFGSPRHAAFAPATAPALQDPIDRLDRLEAWEKAPPALRLLSPAARSCIRPVTRDTDDLLARFARRLEALGVDRLELRHLYVLTLEDFRTRYRDMEYDASIYERALLPDGRGDRLSQWRTPGGTWDPCHYYHTLISGLKRLAAHRAKLPKVIRTLHVTAAGTVIANYRHRTDKGGPPPLTLLAMCGSRICESRTEPGGDPWLVYGEEGVRVAEPGGFLRCPVCDSTAR